MTIVDIAKEAGYSVSTVSRVLNGRRDVSEEARDRIMRIVEAYQFKFFMKVLYITSKEQNPHRLMFPAHPHSLFHFICIFIQIMHPQRIIRKQDICKKRRGNLPQKSRNGT